MNSGLSVLKEKIMIKKVTTEEILCDICSCTLNKPLALRNDGSYQSTFLEYENTHLCFICAGKILDINKRLFKKEEFEKIVNDSKFIINKHSSQIVVDFDFSKSQPFIKVFGKYGFKS